MISVFITWRKCLIGTVAHLALCASAPTSFFMSHPQCGGMSLCALSAPRDLLIRPLHSSRTKTAHIHSPCFIDCFLFFFSCFCHFSIFPSFFLEWPTRKNGQAKEAHARKKVLSERSCGCAGWSLRQPSCPIGCRLPSPTPLPSVGGLHQIVYSFFLTVNLQQQTP